MGIDGVFRNIDGIVLAIFFKNVVIVESNECEVLTILEAPCIFMPTYIEELVVESDLMNAMGWFLQSCTPIGDLSFTSTIWVKQ